MRRIAEGILKKGFTIYNTVFTVKIPKNQRVVFCYDSMTKTQEITFENFPSIRLFRQILSGGKKEEWLASVFGTVMTIHYDHAKPPYPLSYLN